MEIPQEPILEIMKETGAERVDADALNLMCAILKDKIEELTEDAIALAKHADRKTVTADDIKLASKS